MKASASAAAAGDRFEQRTKAARRVLLCYTQSLHKRIRTRGFATAAERCSTRDWESGQKKEIIRERSYLCFVRRQGRSSLLRSLPLPRIRRSRSRRRKLPLLPCGQVRSLGLVLVHRNGVVVAQGWSLQVLFLQQVPPPGCPPHRLVVVLVVWGQEMHGGVDSEAEWEPRVGEWDCSLVVLLLDCCLWRNCLGSDL